MSLTLEEVKHIANLARIELTPEDLENYRTQLSAILSHFEQLQKLDTAQVPPAASSAKLPTGLRSDHTEVGLSLNDLMRNTAEEKENQFVIPSVFD
jgi:aspartyl-tRNA(Asn)/glutamyl-tRNA(Gln) amidotransferase subunit C